MRAYAQQIYKIVLKANMTWGEGEILLCFKWIDFLDNTWTNIIININWKEETFSEMSIFQKTLKYVRHLMFQFL